MRGKSGHVDLRINGYSWISAVWHNLCQGPQEQSFEGPDGLMDLYFFFFDTLGPILQRYLAKIVRYAIFKHFDWLL